MTDVQSVYTYALRDPSKEDEGIISTELRKAHNYYNALIEIERRRRTSVRALYAQNQTIVDLEAKRDLLVTELETVRERIKSEKATTRSGRGSPESEREAKRIRAELRPITEALKVERRAFLATVQPQLDAIDETAAQEHRDARAGDVPYWGTYLLIEQSIQQAKQAKMDPDFKAWTGGDGCIGVQLQGGLPALHPKLRTDTRLRILPVPSTSRARHLLQFRVGTEGRQPKWVTFRLIMHRPLPAGASIKWAKVRRWTFQGKHRYELQLTLDIPTVEAKLPRRAVGVDIGWRLFDDGSVRCAYWKDAEGREGELRLSPDLVGQMLQVERIRGYRDTDRDAMQKDMGPLLAAATLPADIRIDNFAEWKSCKRIHSLWWWWKEHRVTGDESAFDRLTAWRTRDKHLWDFEEGARRRYFARRKEQYRLFAKQMSAYDVIGIEDFRLNEVAEHPAPEDGTKQPQAPAHQRVMVGCYELRGTVKNTAAREGVHVIAYPAEYTTLTCAECGDVGDWNTAPKVEHTCEACGATWDQDANAAKNLLASVETTLDDPEALAALTAPKTKRSARFAKRHKDKEPVQ